MQSRSAEIAATVADPAPVLQLIVVSAVEILQGAAGVIALLEGDRLVPRASYGLPPGALASLHPRLDRAILNVLGQLGEQVSVLYLPSGFGDWARRYHVLALPMQHARATAGRHLRLPPRPTRAASRDRDLHVLDVFARQAAGALQQARATADMLAEKTRLEEMQSTFVSIVSHELQTPVAIIKSYAATLAREDANWPPETIQRVSHNIEEECDRLHRLITDLLDLSRIQAGRVAMRVGSVDLPQLVAEIIDQLAPRSPRHSLRSSFPPNFPIIRGDADQLRRALFNLVQNAIKYSPNGGEVLVVGEAAGQHGGAGAGHRPRQWHPAWRRGAHLRAFSQGRQSALARDAGVGSACTSRAASSRGTAGANLAESTGPGRGSVFTILLPVGEAVA